MRISCYTHIYAAAADVRDRYTRAVHAKRKAGLLVVGYDRRYKGLSVVRILFLSLLIPHPFILPHTLDGAGSAKGAVAAEGRREARCSRELNLGNGAFGLCGRLELSLACAEVGLEYNLL